MRPWMEPTFTVSVGIGVQETSAGAIVIGERAVGNFGGGSGADELAGRRRKRKHDGANDGGVVEADPVSEFVGEERFEIVGALTLRSRERGGRGVGGLAVVAEKSVGIENLPGEERWSGGTDGDAGALAVMVRVKASTPVENPELDWLKQMVLSPSTLFSASLEQELAVATRASGAISPGFSAALKMTPETPDQAPKDAEMACSISLSCAGVLGAAAVRMVG